MSQVQNSPTFATVLNTNWIHICPSENRPRVLTIQSLLPSWAEWPRSTSQQWGRNCSQTLYSTTGASGHTQSGPQPHKPHPRSLGRPGPLWKLEWNTKLKGYNAHMLHLAYIRGVFSNSSGTVCTLCGPINTKLNLQVLLHFSLHRLRGCLFYVNEFGS